MAHRKYTNINSDTRNKVIKLYQSNWGTVDIANTLGISKSAVKYIEAAYYAVAEDRWDTVAKLMHGSAISVKWALNTLDKQIPDGYEDTTGASNKTAQEPVVTSATDTEILLELRTISEYLAEIVRMLK